MQKIKTHTYVAILSFIMLSVLLCSSPSFASGTSSTSQAEGTITIPLTQWKELKANNEKAFELNRSVQSSIDRSSKLGHEAKGRVDRSTQYNHEIGERITNSQGRLSEARSYLERNAELFRRIEEQSRERQENYQTSTDATQPIPSDRGGSDNRSSDSSIER